MPFGETEISASPPVMSLANEVAQLRQEVDILRKQVGQHAEQIQRLQEATTIDAIDRALAERAAVLTGNRNRY